MSLTIFPAPAGTYLLEREQGAKEARKVPVLGFSHIQGGIVFPLCAIPHGGLTRGRALLTADGFVTDPSYGVVCGTVEEWMVLTALSSYWTGSDKAPGVAPQEAASDDGPESTSDVQRQAERPATAADNATPRRIPDKPAGKTQVFINKTFWQHVGNHGDIDYIFVVEGGEPAPAKNAPGFLKIKRDEFQIEKKAGMTVVEDWRTGVVEEPGSDDLDEVGDGSDLI